MPYSKKVMQHFTKPHNQGVIKKADGVGLVGNPKCGDIMRLYIKVGKPARSGNKNKEEVITDAKFETLGCGAAIATSSMITDLAKGKTLKEAGRISRKDVATELDGLPPAKMHCSNLAADALHKAIEDYRKKSKK